MSSQKNCLYFPLTPPWVNLDFLKWSWVTQAAKWAHLSVKGKRRQQLRKRRTAGFPVRTGPQSDNAHVFCLEMKNAFLGPFIILLLPGDSYPHPLPWAHFSWRGGQALGKMWCPAWLDSLCDGMPWALCHSKMTAPCGWDTQRAESPCFSASSGEVQAKPQGTMKILACLLHSPVSSLKVESSY